MSIFTLPGPVQPLLLVREHQTITVYDDENAPFRSTRAKLRIPLWSGNPRTIKMLQKLARSLLRTSCRTEHATAPTDKHTTAVEHQERT